MGNVNPLNALHCGAFAKYVCNACRCKSQCCDEAVICSIETDEVSVASDRWGRGLEAGGSGDN